MFFKKILFISSLSLSISLYSQNIEFYAGYGRNILGFSEQYYRDDNTTENGVAYSFQLAIENIATSFFYSRFTLGYDFYEGKFKKEESSSGGRSTDEIEFKRQTINFGYFPVNIGTDDFFNFSLGLESHILLHQDLSGIINLYPGGTPPSTFIVNDSDDYSNNSNSFYIGFKARCAFDINISDNLILSPQATIFYGISNEYNKIKSTRYTIGVGIQRRIKEPKELNTL